MAEQNNVSPEQVAQALMQAMGQVNGMMGGQTAPAATGNTLLPAMPAQPVQMGGVPNPIGWSVPVETDINGMTVTVYVQFPAQTFPQFQQIIASMMNMGYQVRAFQRNGGGYGGNGGSYGRGGYGGGYNRGGGYGRKW